MSLPRAYLPLYGQPIAVLDRSPSMTSKPEAPPDERAKDFTCGAGHCVSPAACGFDGPCLAGLPPLPERRALPVIGSGIAGHARGYTADQMCEYARAALLASPSLPLPSDLSDEQIKALLRAAQIISDKTESQDWILVGEGSVGARIDLRAAIAAIRSRLEPKP